MKNIEITTAQKVTIQYELASVGNRIAAFIVDLMVLYGMIILILAVFGNLLGDSQLFQYFVFLVILPLLLFYTLLSEILLDGQTLGKRALGLKVVKLNGDPASAFDYLIRWAFRFTDIWLSAGSVAALLISSSLYSQRLGCLLSGTTVIRKNSSKTFNLKDILNIYNTENYQPRYPQVVEFDERDMIFLKKVLERNKKYKNDAHRKVVRELADKMAQMLDVVPPKDKVKFLETVLSDFIVLTR
jgi:uncharacterized RDD family membrane protein YckC